MENVGEFIDGSRELTGILNEFGNTAERDEEEGGCLDGTALGIHIKDTAEDHDQRDGEVVDEVDGGTEGRAVEFGVIIRVHCFPVLAVKSGADLVLTVIALNGATARDHFLRVAVELTEHTGTLAEQGTDLLGAVARKKDGYGNGDDEDKDHGLGDLPHEDQGADDGVYARHDLYEVVRERGVDGVYVVGDAADDIARRVRVEIIDGQGGQLFKELTAHFVDDPLGEADHQNGEKIRHDGGASVADEHADNVVPYDVELYAPFCHDRVDGIARIVRTEQGKLVGEQGEGDGTEEERPFLHYVLQKTAQDPARRFAVELRFVRFVGVVIHAWVACKASIQRWHLPSEIH